MSDRPARQSTPYTVARSLSSYLLSCANEPTVGLYYIQEHVKVTLPSVLETDQALIQAKEKVGNALLDAKKTVQDVKEVAELTKAWSPFMITMLQETNDRLNSWKALK